MRSPTVRLDRIPRAWRVSLGADATTGEDITLDIVLSCDGWSGRESASSPTCPVCGYSAIEEPEELRYGSFDPPPSYTGTGPISRSWSASEYGRRAGRIGRRGCGKADQLTEDFKALGLPGSGDVLYDLSSPGSSFLVSLLSALDGSRAAETDAQSTGDTCADEAAGEGGTP